MGAGPVGQAPRADTSSEHYVSELSNARASQRLYAVRVLEARVRRAIQATEHHAPGDLEFDDATSELQLFDEALAPACVAVLGERNVAPACADILGLLETKAALPALEAAQKAPVSNRAARHIRRAIGLIEAASPAPRAQAPAPEQPLARPDVPSSEVSGP